MLADTLAAETCSSGRKKGGLRAHVIFVHDEGFRTKGGGGEASGVDIELLVDLHHDALREEDLDDLRTVDGQPVREFPDGQAPRRHLEDLLPDLHPCTRATQVGVRVTWHNGHMLDQAAGLELARCVRSLSARDAAHPRRQLGQPPACHKPNAQPQRPGGTGRRDGHMRGRLHSRPLGSCQG